ncbi:MAG: ABC transporter permease [Cyanobium sp. CZS 25K]|nr:ABC transporter permease [Cyanobium sp. CZS25K]
MAAVSDEPIQRLIRRFERLDARLVVTVTGTGVVVCLGFIELLRSPLQQLSRLTIELLAVRALLFLAPLLVSLLLLLRDGPLLLGDRRPPSSWGPDLLASGLLSVVLLLYFMAAAIVTATLLLNQGDVVGEVGFLIGQLEPARFAATLARAGVYGAICAAICLHQARRGAPGAMDMASRMARAFLLGIAILFCLDLLWTIAIDPLQMGGS